MEKINEHMLTSVQLHVFLCTCAGAVMGPLIIDYLLVVTAKETHPEERFKREILLHLNCIRGKTKRKKNPRSTADNSSEKT